jgi:hypothetical protein
MIVITGFTQMGRVTDPNHTVLRDVTGIKVMRRSNPLG